MNWFSTSKSHLRIKALELCTKAGCRIKYGHSEVGSFSKYGVFPAGAIDNVVSKLKAFDDKGLSEKLYNRNE